jgi:chemotaxis protein histidine kinase CheA
MKYLLALCLVVLLASLGSLTRSVSAQSRVAAEEATVPSAAETAERDDRRRARKPAQPTAARDTHTAPSGEAGEVATPSDTRQQRSGATAEEREAAASAARRERRHERRAAEAEAAKQAAAAADQPVPSDAAPTKAAKHAAAAADQSVATDKTPTKAERSKGERVKVQQPKPRGKLARRTRQPNPEYRRLRDQWHQPVAEPVADPVVAAAIVDTSSGRVPLVISPVNGGPSVSLIPQRDDGGFSDADLELAARAFAPKDMRRTHAIAPHLVDLVYRTMRHFNAPLVRLVSGYRPDRAGSRHTQGRAIDMVIPGVSNDTLAEYVRLFGFCGVGIYPNSGFVHLDVRDTSYFWVDLSLPDERSRSEPHLPHESEAADRHARERGEAPDTFVPGNQREDRAASRTYAKRAQKRRAAAERALTNRSTPSGPANDSGE